MCIQAGWSWQTSSFEYLREAAEAIPAHGEHES